MNKLRLKHKRCSIWESNITGDGMSENEYTKLDEKINERRKNKWQTQFP